MGDFSFEFSSEPRLIPVGHNYKTPAYNSAEPLKAAEPPVDIYKRPPKEWAENYSDLFASIKPSRAPRPVEFYNLPPGFKIERLADSPPKQVAPVPHTVEPPETPLFVRILVQTALCTVFGFLFTAIFFLPLG